ncbi:uncharacterized protein LOC128339418 [Hemicordylus capensis]|uniref:uncharacterized protein LOC128339418 n=1 Tax=Hemicordylus capensis TaxID=884348 RepID=UPI002303350F|nr:uncharacterized protein LOC128339418 [Hemicordylus capensis]
MGGGTSRTPARLRRRLLQLLPMRRLSVHLLSARAAFHAAPGDDGEEVLRLAQRARVALCFPRKDARGRSEQRWQLQNHAVPEAGSLQNEAATTKSFATAARAAGMRRRRLAALSLPLTRGGGAHAPVCVCVCAPVWEKTDGIRSGKCRVCRVDQNRLQHFVNWKQVITQTTRLLTKCELLQYLKMISYPKIRNQLGRARCSTLDSSQ